MGGEKSEKISVVNIKTSLVGEGKGGQDGGDKLTKTDEKAIMNLLLLAD